MKLRQVVLAVVLCQPVPLAQGQSSSGAIEGTVRDRSEAVMAAATVTLAGDRLIGGPRAMPTSPAGAFRFRDLPPGEYTITVSNAGFSTVTRERFALRAGATLVVDFALEVAPVTDVVRVEAPAPMLDVTSPAPNQSLEGSALRDLPSTRAIDALINLVPGVLLDVAFGGTQGSNAVAVDGVDTTGSRMQEPVLRFDQNWAQEVQVSALGAGVAHGAFTGVSANVVLKSGSNHLAGMGDVWTTRPSWVGNNTGALSRQLQESFASREIDRWWDVGAHAGFPLRRDRAWLFTGVQHRIVDDRPAGYAGAATSSLDETRGLAKITAAAFSEMRLEGFVHGSRQRVDAANLANFVDDTALGVSASPQASWNVRLSWPLGSRSQFEAAYSGSSASSEFVARSPATCDGPPAHNDVFTGRRSGNVASCDESESSRHTFTASLLRLLGASNAHEVRVGAQVDRTRTLDASHYPGGVLYLDDGGSPYRAQLWEGDTIRTRTARAAFLAEDRWRAFPQLTVTAGLRVDGGRGSVPAHENVFATTAWSPRIGAALDLGSGHRTVARAHYGRFVDPVFAQRLTAVDDSDVTPVIGTTVTPTGEFVEVSRTVAASFFSIDPDIRHSYVDQFVAGIERQVGDETSVLAQYVWRRFGNFMGLVDTGSQFAPVTRLDPGPDGLNGTGDDGGSITAFSLLPSRAMLVYTNPPAASRRYDAVQLVLRKRNTSAWQAQASYTWSRSEGTVTNGSHANAGLLELGASFVNPNRQIHAYGRAPFDPTHELKLFGTSRITRLAHVRVSGVYRYATGATWTREVLVRQLAQGTARVRVEPRGSRRLEATNTLDLRAEHGVGLGARRRLSLYVEALNVTNRGVATGVFPISGPMFANPTSWADPRLVRAGFSVEF